MQDKMRHPNLRHATCGIIILYNPDIPLLLKNIAGSSAQVERLYLIDNTENNDRYAETLQTIANVSHITLGRNTGIAHALNEGCRLAFEAGFKWAVTLDQDSVLPAGYIDACSRFLENKACHRIGIAGVAWNAQDCTENQEANRVFRVITSGSLTNLTAWKAIGGFRNELFIDCVDTEFCLNLLKNDYEVWQLPYICLEHRLGNDTSEVRVAGRHLCYATHHHATRYYYMARNNLYVSELYRNIFPQHAKVLRKEVRNIIVKILLFEKEKQSKLSSVWQGIRDYRYHVTGPITDKRYCFK